MSNPCALIAGGILTAQLQDSSLLKLVLRQTGAHSMNALPAGRVVALQLYLQWLHYWVWLVLIPTQVLNKPLFRLNEEPVRHVPWLRRVVQVAFIAGMTASLMFGALFATQPALAWRLYFLIAQFHVLAELPFIIRIHVK